MASSWFFFEVWQDHASQHKSSPFRFVSWHHFRKAVEGLRKPSQYSKVLVELKVHHQISISHIWETMQTHPSPNRIPDISTGQKPMLIQTLIINYRLSHLLDHEVSPAQPHIYVMAEPLWPDHHVHAFLHIPRIQN